MNRLLGTALAILVALLVFAPAHAKFYYGAGIGQTSADIPSVPGADIDDSDTEWKIYGGYKVMKYFSVEAGYSDLGEASMTISPTDSTSMEAAGFTVAALGTYPFGEKWHAFAKFGFLMWDADMNFVVGGTPGSFSDDGSDSMFGVGAMWDYNGPGSFRLEYEMMSVDDLDIDTISAGMTFRF